MTEPVPIGVLASGSGTNFSALVHADLGPGRLAVLLSNRPRAGVLDRAREADVPTELVNHRDFSTREAFDAQMVEILRTYGVRWVVLAGFMRLVTPGFLEAFEGRVVNIHPSLLPAFPGLHAQQQALEAGVKLSGCTVHLVDSGLDSGPILAQAAVRVAPDDDLERLTRRILAEEHRLYPAVVRALAEGRLVRTARGPTLEVSGLDYRGALVSPPLHRRTPA